MITAEFKVNKRDFISKRGTILKLNIRKTMKAYSLKNVVSDRENNTVTFNASVRRFGATRDIPSRYTAYYYTEDIPGNDIDTTLKIHISTIGPDAA